MVDRDVLRGKTDRVLHHVARLRARGPLDAAALATDEDLPSLVTMDLQQAVHACADDDLGLPSGPSDAFARLARAGYIGEALAMKLSGAAGLRNLIVHRYGDLDCGRLAGVVRDDLPEMEAFVAALRRPA